MSNRGILHIQSVIFCQLCTFDCSHFLRLQLLFRHRVFTGHLRWPQRKAGESACSHFRRPWHRRCLSDASRCAMQQAIPGGMLRRCAPLYSRCLPAANAVPCTLTRAACPSRPTMLSSSPVRTLSGAFSPERLCAAACDDALPPPLYSRVVSRSRR